MNTAIIGLGNIGSQLAKNLTGGFKKTIPADQSSGQLIAALLPEAGRAIARLITASGFSPVSAGGIDQSIRIEVGGDLHEFGKVGKLVSAQEAEALV